jgi:hypothetical protein
MTRPWWTSTLFVGIALSILAELEYRSTGRLVAFSFPPAGPSAAAAGVAVVVAVARRTHSFACDRAHADGAASAERHRRIRLCPSPIGQVLCRTIAGPRSVRGYSRKRTKQAWPGY